MKRIVVISIILALFSIVGRADSLSLDKEEWQNRVKDIDYSENVEPKKARKPNAEISQNQDTFEAPMDLDNFRTIVFAILIMVALIVIALIIKNAKAPATLGKNRLEARSLEEAEENLPDVELNNLLAAAIEAENWKIALRIQFLMLLQELIYAELIVWKKRKTNQQYVQEIGDEAVLRPFKVAVDAFDPAWYGTKDLTKLEFEQIIVTIETLKMNVKNEE